MDHPLSFRPWGLRAQTAYALFKTMSYWSSSNFHLFSVLCPLTTLEHKAYYEEPSPSYSTYHQKTMADPRILDGCIFRKYTKSICHSVRTHFHNTTCRRYLHFECQLSAIKLYNEIIKYEKLMLYQIINTNSIFLYKYISYSFYQ